MGDQYFGLGKKKKPPPPTEGVMQDVAPSEPAAPDPGEVAQNNFENAPDEIEDAPAPPPDPVDTNLPDGPKLGDKDVDLDELDGDADVTVGDLDGQERNIDGMIEDFVAAGLNPEQQDTSAEEAFINTQILDSLGGNLVDQRARMGRAGFGASGALAGLEHDAMRQANLDAEGRIYDVREREQEQAFDEGAAAAGIDLAQQESANRQAILKAQLDALKAMLAQGEEEPDEAGGGAGGGVNGVVEDVLDAVGDIFVGDVDPAFAEAAEDWTGGGQPLGVYAGEDETYDYYRGVDGKEWRVRK